MIVAIYKKRLWIHRRFPYFFWKTSSLLAK